MALPDHIEELLKRLEATVSASSRYGSTIRKAIINPDGPEAAAVIREQAERVERLEAALEPFAEAAKTKLTGPRAYEPKDSDAFPAGVITWGQLRAALAALTPEQETEG